MVNKTPGTTAAPTGDPDSVVSSTRTASPSKPGVAITSPPAIAPKSGGIIEKPGILGPSGTSGTTGTAGTVVPTAGSVSPTSSQTYKAKQQTFSPLLKAQPQNTPSPQLGPVVQKSTQSFLAEQLAGTTLTSPASTIPRNVSFSTETAESKAYQEHNPPTVLRQKDAARARGVDSDSAKFPLFCEPTAPTSSSNIAPQRRRISSPPPPPGSIVTIAPTVSGASAITSPSSQTNVQLNLPTAAHSHTAPAAAAASSSVSAAKDDALQKKNELHILLAVTGSVATIKIPMIIHKLKQIYHQRAIIQLVATSSSCLFFDPAEIPRDVKIWYDEDEWKSRTVKPKLVTADHQLHVQLRRWADILVVAPCSANTLAKLTYGICDNLLTSVFRVWNPQVPMLLAPAMNTNMYTNPVTKRHFNTLKEEFPFVEILKPVEKVLVCGDIGMGGMREWTDIVQIVVKRVGIPPEDPDENEEDGDEDKAENDDTDSE